MMYFQDILPILECIQQELAQFKHSQLYNFFNLVLILYNIKIETI